MRRVRFFNCGHAPAMSANAAVNLIFLQNPLPNRSVAVHNARPADRDVLRDRTEGGDGGKKGCGEVLTALKFAV